jgi:two-component system, LytTR family, response regulator
VKEVRALLVDDEEAARRRLRTMLERAGVAIAGEACDGPEALDAIRRLTPELLFLDVQMPGMSGFDVLEALGPDERPPAIVFVTAYDAHALRAFEVNALDYLLKPYDDERLRESIRRAREHIEQRVTSADPRIEQLIEMLAQHRSKDRLRVRSRNGVQLVDPETIDWLQSEDNYTVLHIGTAELRIRQTLTELEQQLGARGFLRIHRSLMVNESRIVRIEPWAHGEYVVMLRSGAKLRSGRSYAGALNTLMK